MCEDEEGLEAVEGEVKEMLDEMGHSMFLPGLRVLVLLLRPFIRSALHGIFINRDGLEEVKSLVKNSLDYASRLVRDATQKCDFSLT